LLWDKGIYEYIQASRFLLVQGRKIEFLLAGNFDHGNPSSVAESNVYKWVGEGLVKWLGQVDNMALLLKNIDVMVLPSYREGLPTVLTEAAASAVPIVASDVPGCREVVTNGENGFLVPVKNYKALADAIAFLQDNPTLCAQFGEKSRQKALSMFDERITTNATIKIYNELMSK
jgi:glycosyltransferase involved in cell wall biosynthesis